LALTVLGAAIAFQLSYPTGAIPQALVNWGGIILGFYFGSFLTVVKDIVVGREEAAKAASAESGASDAGKQSGNAPPVAAVAR
jgi:hypothetical protein